MTEKRKILDQEALKIILDGHEKLIEILFKSEYRNRFQQIQKIAKLSDALLAIDQPRISMFDPYPINDNDDVKGDTNNIMRAVIEAVTPIVTPIMNAQKEKAKSELRKNYAEELESLIKLRETMKETGDVTDDVIARIDFLKSQIKNDKDEANADSD